MSFAPIIAQASDYAEKVDSVFIFILALSVAFLVFITFLLVFFTIRYSRKRHPKGKDIEGHFVLETVWTLVPLVLFLAMFYYGWTTFEYSRNAPPDAMLVKVVGRQWRWEFEYPGGRKTEQLFAALDRPVRLEITSADVLHGFYAPAFRIKMDAVPGKINTTWFQPKLIGAFDIECTVICGTDHYAMLSKVVVVPEEEFRQWYFNESPNAPLPGSKLTASSQPAPGPNDPVGLAVLKSKTCLTCHSVDGKAMVGPTFKGAFGAKETVVEGGADREVVVDEEFLRAEIRTPSARILKGYPPAMPSVPLTDGEVKDVVEYIKSLKASS